jgi:apolipoprotein N-acyltransferase
MVACGDVNFPNPTRDYAAAGARLMAIPASDEDVNGRQHAIAGMLRGVENGMSIAWAGQRGTLLVSDAYGRVLAEDRTDRTRPFVIVTADLPAGPGSTFYTRTGDWFPWLCAILAVAGLIGSRPFRRRDVTTPAVPGHLTEASGR